MREASKRRTVTDTDSYAFLFLKSIICQRGDDRGFVSNMYNDLRKVTFTLGSYEFLPDTTPQETEKMEELTKERTGYFHQWVKDVDTSKEIPYVKTMALVEDIEDGKLYMVEYNLINFIKPES